MIHLIRLSAVAQHLYEVEKDDRNVDYGIDNKDFSIFLDEFASQDCHIDYNVGKK